jgi:hypothetical protein
MSLPTTLQKNGGVAWGVGAGAGSLDTGALAPSTWYHVHLIKRVDTGVVDLLLSLSATAPNLPANYTVFRRIGSVLTDGSSNFRAMSQRGDDIMWETPPLDINDATLGTTAKYYALSVPPGVNVAAHLRGSIFNAAAVAFYLCSPDEVVAAAAASTGNVTAATNGATQLAAWGVASVRTDTSQQVRAVSNTASSTIRAATIGWTDRRGKD